MPSPPEQLRVVSLCSGIGGPDIAAEWAGMRVVGQVEIDPFCRKVLKHHWPNVLLLEDLFNVRGSEFGEFEVLTAGWPCQPHSVAGKRRGSGDKRDLWPEVRRIIGATKPRWFVGENVPGLFSSDSGRFFGNILSDLAALGYAVGWCTFGAVDVGAWHRRDRVFIVGYSKGDPSYQVRCVSEGQNTLPRGICETLSHTPQREDDRRESGKLGEAASRGQGVNATAESGSQDVPDASGNRLQGCREERHSSGQVGLCGREGRNEIRIISDTSMQRCQECWRPPASTIRLERSRPSITREGQLESCLGNVVDGLPSGLAGYWEREPDGIPRVAVGVKDRVNKLKALGNACVPQQIYPIFKAIADMEAVRCATLNTTPT